MSKDEQSQEDQQFQSNQAYLSSIIQIQHEIALAELDLDVVMNTIVERVQSLTQADGAAIELLEADEMVYRAASGTAAPFVGLRLKANASLSGQCAQTGEISSCEDSETDPRVDREACRRVNVRSMIVVPLCNNQSVVGVLKVLSSRPQAFDESQIQTLQLLAGLTGAAMSHAVEFEARQTLVVELTAALAALQESEKKYRHIVETATEGIWIIDAEGKTSFVNQKMASLLGYGITEILSRSMFDFMDAEGQAIAAANLERRRQGNKAQSEYDFKLRRKDNTFLWTIVSSTPLLDNDGNFQGFLAMLTDITERKQAEDQVRLLQTLTFAIGEAEDVDAALVSILQVVCEFQGWNYGEVWSLDTHQQMLKCQSAWYSNEGTSCRSSSLLDHALPIGLGLPGRVWRSGQPEWRSDVAQAPEAIFLCHHIVLECGLKTVLGVPLIVNDQVLAVLVFFRFEAIQEDQWLIESLTAIATQLGLLIQRKQIGEALKFSEARFQAFMNNSPAVSFMKNEAGQYIYINKTFEDLFDLEQKDLLGKTDRDLMPAEAADQIRENDLTVLATNQTAEVIETVPGADGVLRQWLVFKFPFTDLGQRFVGGVAVDITERQQAEAVLQEFNHALEITVQERTIELQHSIQQLTTEISKREQVEASLQSEIAERKRIEQALFQEKELAQVTLESIGDAVITTDAIGRVQYLNPVAETLTGWSQREAQGLPLPEVFKIVHETTREPAENPIARALREGCVVGLANHTVLLNRQGHEVAIDDSAAPIRASDGAVMGAVMVFHDVSETRNLTQQLSWQASHDALTELFNRYRFELCLEQAIDSAKTQQQQHALCYLDLDQFKIVNDTCGHSAGDELLRQVAGLFRSHIRKTDILARLGGDEFAILLNECPLDQALRIANTLREQVQSFRFCCQNKIFSIGVSIGLIMVDVACESVANVLSAADAACYAAKRRGRNRVHLFEANDRELMQQQGEMQWVPRIVQALENPAKVDGASEAREHFCLYYQSIVPTALMQSNGEHYEVLLRLQSETRELIAPMAFIPAAERYNLMHKIDRWVIQTLFATQKQHYQEAWNQQQQDQSEHLYAINLSGAS
ncbi:MAG: PAS domain S-box protein, partial [Leptolyngbyaceae cyanobacterium SM1_3_5]|nr:PAS domain S-box protein [Leptolyngbyaceae cyanobacterium SM1_3_5]